jgi:hypothetical protein
MNIVNTQIGALPCGFCGLDSTCQTQLTVKKGGVLSISSTCPYHYDKMQYKAAQEPTKTSPCTNLPIHCQLCPPMGISGEPRTIWKYNAIYHLLSEHPPDGIFDAGSTCLPKVPAWSNDSRHVHLAKGGKFAEGCGTCYSKKQRDLYSSRQ